MNMEGYVDRRMKTRGHLKLENEVLCESDTLENDNTIKSKKENGNPSQLLSNMRKRHSCEALLESYRNNKVLKIGSPCMNDNLVLTNPTGDIPDVSGRLYSEDGITVLSLFDGLGTGLFVLDKLKIKVKKYYAVENDLKAYKVSNSHFGKRITNVGSVEGLTPMRIRSFGKIDLLLSGFPCTDFSRVNATRRNIDETESSGSLFYIMQAVVHFLVDQNSNMFWLAENVAGMEKYVKHDICLFLECPPVTLNSLCVSPQNRNRFFWGNIPGLMNGSTKAKLEKELSKTTLADYLDKNMGRKALTNNMRTVTKCDNSLSFNTIGNELMMDGRLPIEQSLDYCENLKYGHYTEDRLSSFSFEKATVTEIEDVFGFPRHYTDTGTLSLGKRRRLLGQSWSVLLIEQILRPLKDILPKNV